MDQLSGMDASFLHLETPETPMHVGNLSVLELPKGYKGDYYEDVKAQVAKPLASRAVLSSQAGADAVRTRRSVWIEDDDIDIDYHVRHVTVPVPARWRSSSS